VVLGQENYSNLKLLIEKADSWVVAEFDRCCEIVTKELEAVPYEELLKRGNVEYRKPTLDDIGQNRRHKP